MPTQVDIRPDLMHGKFVVDHGLWCHVCGHNAPRNTSKCQLEWSSEGLEAEEEQFLLLECAQELLKRGYAKHERELRGGVISISV